MQAFPPIVELRRYTLKPGRRDELIELFEREFVESQEATGMTLLGQFRDLDAPDRFVWMRGFPDMERRREGLSAFYGGPVWKAHRAAANATMIDSDNVLLLRPVGPAPAVPPRPEAPRPGRSPIRATVLYLDAPADADLIERLTTELQPAGLLGAFVSEPSPNTFPALPVREGEFAVVWLTQGEADAPEWIRPRLVRPPEVMRLSPTPRSRLG